MRHRCLGWARRSLWPVFPFSPRTAHSDLPDCPLWPIFPPCTVLGLPTPIPIPNLTRLYFKFGVPIDTAEVQLDLRDEGQCQALYDDIRGVVNKVCGGYG